MGTTAVVVPGSFDPVTFGHMGLVERAATHFDHVVVAMLDNPAKSALFTVDERKALIAACVQEFSHVEVDSFAGLLADYCPERALVARQGDSEAPRPTGEHGSRACGGGSREQVLLTVVSCRRQRRRSGGGIDDFPAVVAAVGVVVGLEVEVANSLDLFGSASSR
ncbi:MAG: cytidyltransferase-like protein [Glaciecola sp.]|jgi:cytidyltransferase-like protein